MNTTGKLIVFHRPGAVPHQNAVPDSVSTDSGWSISAIQQSLFPLAKTFIIPILSEEVGIKLAELLQQIHSEHLESYIVRLIAENLDWSMHKISKDALAAR